MGVTVAAVVGITVALPPMLHGLQSACVKLAVNAPALTTAYEVYVPFSEESEAPATMTEAPFVAVIVVER